MALQLLEHPGITLASGAGIDLPHQAARARAMWRPDVSSARRYC